VARFPASFLDELRARLPVSEVVGKRVKLKKAGREWKGLSPFNKEKTPSFFVNDQKAAWFDFSSGKNGNIFDFVMQTEGVDFREAVERLAAMAGVPVPSVSPEAEKQEAQRKTLRQVLEGAATLFEGWLDKDAGAPARAYLRDRGISRETAMRFRIGWAPDERFGLKEALGAMGVASDVMIEAGLLIHGADVPVPYDRFRGRVMFPITDPRGRVVGFGGRALGDEQPKYLNSPETPLFRKGALLYNLAYARLPAHKTGKIFAVEGYLDAIAMDAVGIESTVATLGTALGAAQLALLWSTADEPVLCFDGDAAGARAMSKAVDTVLPLLRPGRSLRFAVLPEGHDPDDLVRSGGREAMQRVLDAARPLVDVLWTRESEPVMTSLNTPERRAQFAGRIREVVATIEDENVRRYYAADLGERVKTLMAAPQNALGGPPERRIEAAYDYEDGKGHLLYQVVAFDDGALAFRRPAPDEDGRWVWGIVAGQYMRKGAGHDWYRFDEVRYVEWGCQERAGFDGARVVAYNLAGVNEAVADGRVVWLARTEVTADALNDQGLVATTCAGHTVRAAAALVEPLKHADVVVLVDNDDAGRQFAQAALQKLRGTAGRIRVLDVGHHWTGCPPGAGLPEWFEAGGDEDSLWALVEQLAEWKPQPPPSHFGAMRFVDIDLPAREHAWLIKGILTQAEMSFLSGQWQSGKSFLALDIAFLVARAADETDLTFFGRRIHGGLAIYQAGEGKLGLRKRMRAYRDYHGIPANRDLPLVLMPREINLHANDDHTDKFIAEAKAWSTYYGIPIVLVVIDTFAKATQGANENASEDMSRVLARGQRISEALGAHVLFVHHLNAGGTKVRGHSSLMGNVENAIEVGPTEHKETEEIDGHQIVRVVREARISKQKDGEYGGRWNFVLKQVVIGRDLDGEPITSCVVCPTNEAVMPVVTNARKDNVGIFLNSGRVIFFRDALMKALNEHGVPPPPELRLPASVDRVVEWDLVKIAYRKAAVPDEGEAKDSKDKLKTYVRRYREFFQAQGVMATDTVSRRDGEVEVATSYVWLTGKPVYGSGFAWPTRRKERKVGPDRVPIDPATGKSVDDEDLPF
jgi:DNA primase catalytic core